MNPQDFIDKPPGSLVQIFGGHAAFVPALLPPTFKCDSENLADADMAMLALGELRAIIPTLPNPTLLTYPFLRREAVLSSRIEGTHTDLGQLYLFEAATSADPAEDERKFDPIDAREVHNYVVALMHGLKQLADLPVCNRLIREMHRRLMDGVTDERGAQKNPGDFRHGQAYIGGADIGSARYVAPPATAIEDLMADLEKYFYAPMVSHPTLVRLAVAHYQFEAIHPFSDGNGRCGRLLISLLLAAWQILPYPLLYLSAYFERNSTEYSERLWRVSCAGEWNDWVRFFVRGVNEVAKDATARSRALLGLREKYRQQLQSTRGAVSSLALVDILFTTPFFTIPEAAEALAVTYNAAKKNVAKLEAAGIVECLDNRRRNKLYCARDVLKALE